MLFLSCDAGKAADRDRRNSIRLLRQHTDALTRTVLPVLLLPWPTQLQLPQLRYVVTAAQKAAVACSTRLQSLEASKETASKKSRRMALVTSLFAAAGTSAIAAMNPIKNEDKEAVAKEMIGIGGGLITAALAAGTAFGNHTEILSLSSRRIGEIRNAIDEFTVRWSELLKEYAPSSDGGVLSVATQDAGVRLDGGLRDAGDDGDAGLPAKTLWSEDGSDYRSAWLSAMVSAEGLKWYVIERESYLSGFDLDSYEHLDPDRSQQLQFKLAAEVSALLRACADHVTVKGTEPTLSADQSEGDDKTNPEGAGAASAAQGSGSEKVTEP